MTDKERFPFTHKAGRYVFYGFCSFGAAMAVGLLLDLHGFTPFMIDNSVWLVGIGAFLALRDMEKAAFYRGVRAGKEPRHD